MAAAVYNDALALAPPAARQFRIRMPIIFLAFLTVPLLEIFLLIKVGSIIGAVPTILIVVFTAVLGTVLLRIQGLETLQRIRLALAEDRIPAAELVEGAALLLGGALLLTPGFITDACGFALLLPPVRRWLAARLLQRMVVRMDVHTSETRHRTLEGEFWENHDRKP